jgi:hypothetical protein
VLKALKRFGAQRNRDARKRTGRLPFGFDYSDHQLVKNGAEHAAIRMMRQYRAGRLSLREIAGNVSMKLIPAKVLLTAAVQIRAARILSISLCGMASKRAAAPDK